MIGKPVGPCRLQLANGFPRGRKQVEAAVIRREHRTVIALHPNRTPRLIVGNRQQLYVARVRPPTFVADVKAPDRIVRIIGFSARERHIASRDRIIGITFNDPTPLVLAEQPVSQSICSRKDDASLGLIVCVSLRTGESVEPDPRRSRAATEHPSEWQTRRMIPRPIASKLFGRGAVSDHRCYLQ